MVVVSSKWQVVVNSTVYNIIKVSDDGYIVTAIIAARGK